MLRKLLLLSLTLALAAVSALAQSTDSPKDLKEMQKQATRLDSKASQGEGTVLNSLSTQLNVPVATLQAEQKSTNFGPGQLFIANSLATASGKTFDQIAQEFKSGKGWGEIAKENNLKLGKVVSDLKRANTQVEKDRAEQAQASEKGGNGSSHAASNANANANANANGSANANANANANQHGASMGGGPSGSRGRH